MALLLLLGSGAAATAAFTLLPEIDAAYQSLAGRPGGSGSVGPVAPVALRLRVVVGLLLLLMVAAAKGRWRDRACAMAVAGALYMFGVVAYDAAASWLPALAHEPGAPATQMLQPLVIATVSLVLVVFLRYELPAAVVVERLVPDADSKLPLVLFGLTTSLALLTFAVVSAVTERPSLFLRSVPILALGAGVMPFSLVQTPLLYRAARSIRAVTPSEERPSVAVLIPALNEAEHIEACLASIAAATLRYDGRCRVYLVDNGSRDGTAQIAAAFLAGAGPLEGEVVLCSEPGKARALNAGLRRLSEDLVLRVDADTVLGSDAIRLLVVPFADPRLGAVGGLPLPARTDTWIGRMRCIEVQLNIAIRRVAHTAVQSVMCLPGNAVAYRRPLLQQLGGFAEGINGEDTDITLRIARSGHGIAVAPEVRAWTAVPATLAELREQRMRWTRAGFHVAARNRTMIRPSEGPRGLWYFPLGIFAAHARVLLLPLFVGMLTTVTVRRGHLGLIESVELIAVAIGARMLVSAAVLSATGHRRSVRALPGYVLFRLLVLFFGLESFLTLPLRQSRPSPAADAASYDPVPPTGPGLPTCGAWTDELPATL